jgi:hypothetical protein
MPPIRRRRGRVSITLFIMQGDGAGSWTAPFGNTPHRD